MRASYAFHILELEKDKYLINKTNLSLVYCLNKISETAVYSC